MKRSALSLLSASFDNAFSEQPFQNQDRGRASAIDCDTSSGTRWRVVRTLEAGGVGYPETGRGSGQVGPRKVRPSQVGASEGGSTDTHGEGAYERNKRKRLVKARTLSTQRLEGRTEEVGQFPDFAELAEPRTRPTTRAECAREVRPCPYVSCRYHLYLEVSPRTGSLKLNFPDLEVWELTETCSLDIAERGAQSTEFLGEVLNLTPERARQLEQNALRSVATSLDRG